MGLGLNISGMADGYQGFKAEQRRIAEDDRKAAADAQALKDHAFAEDARNRQRYEWSEVDRKVADKRRSNAAYWDENSGTPTSAAGAVAPAAAAPDAGGSGSGMTTQPVADPAAGITPSGAPAVAAALPAAAPVDSELDGPPPTNTLTPAPAAAPPATAKLAAAPPAAAPIDVALDGPPQTNIVGTAPAAPAAPSTPSAPSAGIASAPAAPSAAGVSPPPAAALAPGAVGGIPKPRVMGNMLDMYARQLDDAARSGDVDAEAYAKTRDWLAKARSEGVTVALDAFARGDYEGGLAAYNSIGQYKGARIAVTPVSTSTTLPDGTTVPTTIVTIANADGSRAVIDTTLDRYKMIGLEKQVDMITKATAANSLAGYHTALGEAAKKNADTTAGYRADQNNNMIEQRRLQELGIMAKTAAGTQEPVNWTAAADAYLVEAAKGKDADGNVTNDGAGLNFTKLLGINYARQNGGDAMAGAGEAVAIDNQLKTATRAAIAKAVADKLPPLDYSTELRRQRQVYLSKAVRAAPAQQPAAQPGQTAAAAPGGVANGDYFHGISAEDAAIIREVASAKGVDPNDLAAVLQLEKSRTDQVSPAGARGRWQIMPANVQAYGGDPLDFRQGAAMAANVMHDGQARYPGPDARARIAYYNGGYKAGDAVAGGGAPPTDEGRGYVTRYDAMRSAAPAAAASAPTAPPTQGTGVKAPQVRSAGGLIPSAPQQYIAGQKGESPAYTAWAKKYLAVKLAQDTRTQQQFIDTENRKTHN